ncbi:hypothetical protein HanRHA438_Chr03g0100891 [Helianthus annuus]|nr:hypothetical protein HanRHA438_Chr03g0100891 [Helianthus annuus]
MALMLVFGIQFAYQAMVLCMPSVGITLDNWVLEPIMLRSLIHSCFLLLIILNHLHQKPDPLLERSLRNVLLT